MLTPIGDSRNQLWRSAVVQETHNFIASGEKTDDISRASDRILAGVPVIRISHQPNLFASLNIGGLLIIAEHIAARLDGVVVFVSIDYDEAGDQRFRSGLLPPIHGKEPVRLSGAVPRTDRQRIAFAAPPPSPSLIQNWINLHNQAVSHWSTRLGVTKKPNIFVGLDISALSKNATSLSDFNLALLSHLSGRLTTVPTLFVRASRCLAPLALPIQELVIQVLTTYPEHHSSLVWRVCSSCYRRCPGRLTLRCGKVVFCNWECATCGGPARDERLDWTTRLSAKCSEPAFVPRVLLCDMIDFHLLQSDLSVSYANGVQHTLRARSIYQTLPIARMLQPALYWQPQNLRLGPADALWRRGRFSTYFYHDVFGAQALRNAVLQNKAIHLI